LASGAPTLELEGVHYRCAAQVTAAVQAAFVGSLTCGSSVAGERSAPKTAEARAAKSAGSEAGGAATAAAHKVNTDAQTGMFAGVPPKAPKASGGGVKKR
jgi:hypothetical protein